MVITPPFRSALLTENGVPFTGDDNSIQTTRDWWLYWQQLTDQGNSNSRLATEGTHGSRPLPDGMPDGALYYESDRGVLYSHANGIWQYVAGTMYGTLSPDERPTDLGTHDAGFSFRGTDQPREFLWSQTEWIEVTAVQYGPHAARPDPATIVEGALYVESDRGGVIYQRETPAGTPLWQYLAGTMWGTLVPDQRPTDLGTHDAGFDFRTSVAPAREFIWNQTAWVEITALVDPTTTKGDLIVHGTATTRFGVGSDGQLLAADSTQALGVRWVAPPAQTPWLSNINGGGFNLSNAFLVTVTGGLGIGMTAGGGYQLQLSSDFASKATTSTWAIVSDGRLKQNVRPLQGGLSVIERLKPVEAEHNGLHGTKAGQRIVSLIAQEAREVLPNAVVPYSGKLRPDDVEEGEILYLNPHEILFHLILAVQQLSRKVGL